MTILSDKPALRVRMRAIRKALSAGRPDAAHRAADHLPLERLPPFAVVSGYMPLGSEFDPRPVMLRLADAGARLALPVALSRDAPLAFRVFREGDPLEPDAFGIPAPLQSAPPVEPDLVLAPVLAFDRRGGRLGQGAGHYDRTLENLRARKAVFVLGLAYAGQELDAVPSEPHDQRLDAILTETDFISVAKGP